MGKPKLEKTPDPGCPLWMLSFGDTISLLVTFFVMLLAFSDFDEAKLLNLMGALKGGLSAMPSRNADELMGAKGKTGDYQGHMAEAAVPDGMLSKIATDERLTQNRYSRSTITRTDDGYFARMLKEGLSVIIQTDALFEPGTADFKKENNPLFSVICDMAGSLTNEIRILSILPRDIKVRTTKVQTPMGLGAAQTLAFRSRLLNVSDFDENRFSLGVQIRTQPEADLPAERMEVVMVGYRDAPKTAPEKPIIHDNWN